MKYNAIELILIFLTFLISLLTSSVIDFPYNLIPFIFLLAIIIWQKLKKLSKNHKQINESIEVFEYKWINTNILFTIFYSLYIISQFFTSDINNVKILYFRYLDFLILISLFIVFHIFTILYLFFMIGNRCLAINKNGIIAIDNEYNNNNILQVDYLDTNDLQDKLIFTYANGKKYSLKLLSIQKEQQKEFIAKLIEELKHKKSIKLNNFNKLLNRYTFSESNSID